MPLNLSKHFFKGPIIENAIYSEKVYKTVVGSHVHCRIHLDPNENIEEYRLASTLTFENNHNKKIEHEREVMSDTSAILIDTLTLNISDTYSCCLEITIGKQRKCSILVISPYISSDFTLIAKMIGVLEMLLLICIFSLCLLGSIMRFKARQNNKVIDAALKEIGDEDFEKFGGPYIVTPHAEAMRTHVTSENLKNIVLQDADPKIVDRMADGDFPPSYEELALRRMSRRSQQFDIEKEYSKPVVKMNK